MYGDLLADLLSSDKAAVTAVKSDASFVAGSLNAELLHICQHGLRRYF